MLLYIKQFQFERNNKGDKFVNLLKALGLMCSDLHTGKLSWEDYSHLGDWKYHEKLAEELAQKEAQGTCEKRDDESDVCPQKHWICPGCGHVCKGKTFMRKRNYHKKNCKYFDGTSDFGVYTHKTSHCTCCIFDAETGMWQFFKDAVAEEEEKEMKDF